jgi:hypothetical protein
MPIRINLLAEAQIAEDLRRRDPVKFTIYGGAFLLVLSLVWASSLQLEAMISKNDLSQIENEITSRTNEYQQVLVNQKKVADARTKLGALQKLTSSRFLQGNLLNALQQATAEGVQLTRVRVDQSYFTMEGTASVTNNDRVIPGRSGTTSERIVLTLDARDFSASPGDQVNKFKEALTEHPYFKAILNKTNGVQLISLSPPQNGSDGKPYVLFTLECNFQEQTR